jgi:hypothetical protein
VLTKAVSQFRLAGDTNFAQQRAGHFAEEFSTILPAGSSALGDLNLLPAAFGDQREAQIAVVIQQQVEFQRSLGLPKLRPIE